MTALEDALVQVRGISKAYGGVQALQPIDLEIHAGEIHALCGENGAGKSTFNRILSGVILPDSGSVMVADKELRFGSVPQAEEIGISIVHQESMTFLDLTGTENHQLMHEPTQVGGLWLDRKEMNRRTVASLAKVGENFNPNVKMEERSVAQRQMLEISRALDANCRLLILDEPTASLSARESEALFEIIKKMRRDGVAILYVSHRLEEIFDLADRVTVLRDGHLVFTKEIADTSPPEIVQAMIGRHIEASQNIRAQWDFNDSEIRLKVNSLTQKGTFENISFEVRSGEIYALAGLIGAGRSEVARAIFGLDSLDSGEILIDGNYTAPSPQNAIKHGIGLVPEDRQHEGLHLQLSVRENLMMVATPSQPMTIKPRAESGLAGELINSLSIKTQSDLMSASNLSGGNQQKVLLGKWLAEKPRILILDEPTRGVDVGAKYEIHQLVRDLATDGVAILLISSELAEVTELADRVGVMRQGRLAEELCKEDISQSSILKIALPIPGEFHEQETKKKEISRELGVGILLLFLLVFASVINPRFFSLGNLRDVLVDISPALIVGTMMTFVVLAREIDISVGSLMGLSAAILGLAASPNRFHLAPGLAVVLCLATGAAGGLFNGLLVSYGKIPSIIATLGTLALFRGIAELALGGNWITSIPHVLRLFGIGSLFSIPYVIIAAVVVILVGVAINRRSAFGSRVQALGSNPDIAALIGINGNKFKLILFTLTGLSAAVAALFSSTKLQVIESSFGTGFELVVVAAVIIGGTSIRGGRGTVVGTVIATALLGVVSTALIFMRLGESATYWDPAIQGAFILLAVLGDQLNRKGREVR